MEALLPYVVLSLLIGWVLSFNVSAWVNTIAEFKKDEKLPSKDTHIPKLTIRKNMDAVSGTGIVVQAKLLCPNCGVDLKEDQVYFGMQIYRCHKDGQFIRRGKGRLTPLSDVLNTTTSALSIRG